MIQDTTRKLKQLRKLISTQGLDGYIIPRQDEFQGEYVAAYAERLNWISGFSGSWGVGVVLTRTAALFVDGRYTVQAKAQISAKLWQQKHLIDEPPTTWLTATLKRGQKIGFDPMLFSIAETKRYAAACAEVGAKFVPISGNLIDRIWEDQPARPQGALFTQALAFAGRSVAQKLADLQAEMKKLRRNAVLLTDPASVAWLFNLRGKDVPFTPVVLAYALVHDNGQAQIFIESQRVPASVLKGLGRKVKAVSPTSFAKALKALSGRSVQLDENSAPEFAREQLRKAKAHIVHGTDPCLLPKACKNKVEQQGARDAQRRDGAALVNFLHWFSVEAPKGKLDEAEAADKLHAFRSATGALRDLSFESIPASGPNAALPHYHLPTKGGRHIKLNEIFLIDSGGQYLDGTTDVTRTVIIGKPTAEMKDRFTRVLKGMIGISLVRFPAGTTGAHIDVLARASLWDGGFDFDHGTGHGVGSYLSVHEGPQRISKAGHVVMKPGMIISNEPGYYKLGHYGIRIENLLLVSEASKIASADRPMMAFETLTLAPIDRNLINAHMLTRAELNWLDRYHARVLAELGPLVHEETLPWLKAVCAPLS
ncbi:MAG: aminopeptidase P family protein [Aestuariivirga sp.]